MTAAAMHGTDGDVFAAGLILFFLLICATLFVGITYRWLVERLASKVEKRPGKVPEETYRSFREPFDRERVPESGLTNEQLERWPVIDQKPHA